MLLLDVLTGRGAVGVAVGTAAEHLTPLGRFCHLMAEQGLL